MQQFFAPWLSKNWWKYLFAPKAEDVSWWVTFNCRRKGHPCGIVFYNPSGYEPDTTCRDCGDDLG